MIAALLFLMLSSLRAANADDQSRWLAVRRVGGLPRCAISDCVGDLRGSPRRFATPYPTGLGSPMGITLDRALP
jgi:hypothetical protein